VRGGERTKLVFENWAAFGSGGFAILSGGIRFFGERLSADLGLGMFVDSGDVSCWSACPAARYRGETVRVSQ
jgi:hypothetical protein